MKKSTLLIASSFALSAGLLACQTPAKGNDQQELKTLIAKVDAIDKKLDRMQARGGRAQAPAPKRPTVGQLYNVGVSSDDAYRGGKNAKVTVAVASEFACPYCRLLADAIDPLLEKYTHDDLKVVSKHFVVHPSVATKPALAACAASKQGKFSEYENALWLEAWEGGERPRLKKEGLAEPSLDRIASELHLDMDRFHSDMQGSCQQTISRNRKEMATLGVNGTPAVYINGIYYGGPRTTEGLKEAVDKELAKANTALAKGGQLETYYDGLVAKGKARL